MEPLNLKVLPFALLALVFSFLAFNSSVSLITNFEILLDLALVLKFIIFFSLFVCLASLFISLVLTQVANNYYRAGLFFLIFLPFASVFILKFLIDPLPMVAILILFIAMIFSMLMEFNHLYANQIRTDISTPAKANARTIAFFVAITTAVVFFSVNNNEVNQDLLAKRILVQINGSITQVIDEYDLTAKISEQMGLGPISQTKMGQDALGKMAPQINTYIADQVTAMIEPYMPYVVYILSFLIFTTIAGTATFIGILTSLLGITIIYILKSTGYMHETKQMVEVSRITL